jgi:hypothetical protein
MQVDLPVDLKLQQKLLVLLEPSSSPPGEVGGEEPVDRQNPLGAEAEVDHQSLLAVVAVVAVRSD